MEKLREEIVRILKYSRQPAERDADQIILEVQPYLEQAKREIVGEIRELWTWETSCGHPAMSIALQKWVNYCRQKGINEGWWELEHEDFKQALQKEVEG